MSPVVTTGITRTDHEINAELFRLYSLERRTPSCNEYGEPVADAKHAQIEMLRRRLAPEETEERYEDAPLFVISEALNAADWMRDDGESPSSDWPISLV